MPRPTPPAILAWSPLVAIVLALAAMFALTPPDPDPELGAAFEALQLFVLAELLSFAVVGALVASHMPRNPIGWMLILSGTSFTTGLVIEELLKSAPADPAPELAWVALLSGVLWIPFIATIPLMILLFPDGRMPSKRWRLFVVAHVVFFVLRAAAELGSEEVAGVGVTDHVFPNPLPVASVLRAARAVAPDFGPVYAFWFIVPTIAAVRRFRRSRGIQRQQLKWFAYAAGLAVAGMSLLIAVQALGHTEGPLVEVLWMAVLVSLGTIPISVGLAIFRFRLYDIDVLINRTIVYGALTVVLLSTYLASVLAAQRVLGALTGASEVGVAASTLLVVALFHPLRRRIQDAVDHRFYRARYDAQRTLDLFAARLRDEVDLDDVRTQLLAAVHATLQPRGANVWLRSDSPALGRNDFRTPDG